MTNNGLQSWTRKKGTEWTGTRAKDANQQAWPVRTDVYCFWCCHPFETRPVPLPVAYDDRKDTFKVIGTFCSWNCAKTYNMTGNSSEWGHRSELLHMLYKRTEGPSATRIATALPKTRLKIFGGDLGIEDFRTLSGDARCERPVFPRVEYAKIQAFDGTKAPEQKPHEAVAASSRTLTFDNLGAGKNETLKLKRSKPLPTKTSNILEKVLGLDPAKASATSRGQK